MKRIVIAILFLLSCSYLHGQTISGKVYRAGTDSVIASASIYYSGSMAGTITDKQGRFELKVKQQQIPIIVSCIGYQSATVTYEPGKPLIVYLTPKLEGLHEVTIRVDGMGRKEEIEIFTREFIGNSTYALSCNIKNIDDINLFYSKKTGVLTASADKPIIIENKKLGYTITYFLDNFERTYKDVRFGGNYIFKEDKAAPPQTQAKIISNREDAYIGSRMQFIRALWYERIDKTGFRLYSANMTPLSERDMVKHDSLMQKYVVLENKVFIYHSSDPRRPTALLPKEKYSFIDKDGYYGEGLKWGGVMGNQRIGDLLPFEYISPGDVKGILTKAKKDTLNSKNITKAEPGNKKYKENKDLNLFKQLVLLASDPVDDELIIRKWVQPINYKIYGTCGDTIYDKKIAANVAGLFKQVAECSGLQINEAGKGEPANFSIFMGKLNKFKDVMPRDAREYFSVKQAFIKNTGYYHWWQDGFTDMIQLVDVDAIGQNKLVWNQVKIQVMNGLGFLGSTSKYNESIFYTGVNNWVPESGISVFDQHIIKALYQPTVKSGMTEQELDAVLKNMQL